jgi:hypothetical protein
MTMDQGIPEGAVKVGNPLLDESWPLQRQALDRPLPRRGTDGVHRGTGRHRGPPRPARFVPTLAGSTGMCIALLNVYPTLYPWHSALDKLVGLAVCGLVAALGARVIHLANGAGLDPGLVVLGIALLLVIALAAIIVSTPSGTTSLGAGRGCAVSTDPAAGERR